MRQRNTMTIHDAIKIAKGCMDCGGGHHSDGKLEAFHHGIQTVVNALEAAAKHGFADSQVNHLWIIGKTSK